MPISATSATALTNALTEIKTRKRELDAARARYRQAYDVERHTAYRRGGLTAQQALAAQLDPILVDRLLAASTLDDDGMQRLVQRIQATKTTVAA